LIIYSLAVLMGCGNVDQQIRRNHTRLERSARYDITEFYYLVLTFISAEGDVKHERIIKEKNAVIQLKVRLFT
jgi:hypothetical protein